MQWILFIVLLIGAALFLRWAITGMLRYSCPTCSKAGDGQGVLVPVIPGLRWWCVNCSTVCSHEDVRELSERSDSDS